MASHLSLSILLLIFSRLSDMESCESLSADEEVPMNVPRDCCHILVCHGLNVYVC
ncbi:hypothetical protein J4Q44_G00139180 [Coregonus suidteri]|uniref:Uncharacterized protein n=1 Tax=Coregonus suidteri TaxID=861788 RepID=A0AAN8LTR2_9TELE